MCGIAGFFRHAPWPAGDWTTVLRRMTDRLAHRGPDDAGIWSDEHAGCALGHRRLAIVDLSPTGHQPMTSRDGRYVIAYNGEVFNFLELRATLEAEGVRFRGTSDTEVILEGCARWGVKATVQRMIGMWGMAVWDTIDARLTLVRDRLGVKPLYWALHDGWTIFGSELKALRAHPALAPKIDRGAVAAFMRHNYIPAPFTIFEGVYKLEPGSLLLCGTGMAPVVERYWDLRDVAADGAKTRLPADGTTVDRVAELLADAVKRRMIADVPLGALLSGGIDSSLVTALMQAQSGSRIKTFSIGFDDPAYDESGHARAIAEHLGTDHTELRVDAVRAMDVVPLLPHIWDEPFADSSQLPTYLVCQLTRQHVTVVLSGDGGDELFCGYTRYVAAARLAEATGGLPQGARAGLAHALRWLQAPMVSRFMPPGLASKVDRVAGGLRSGDPDETYRQMLSHFSDPEALVPGARERRGRLWEEDAPAIVPEFVARMQYLDTMTYLPDDILTKVDRASMAVALEVRVPLLDHRLVELSWRVPAIQKLRDGKGKWILRRILSRYVPDSLVDRPKMGFGVPLDSWLRGPLRDWAMPLLDSSRLKHQGLLDPAIVNARWQAHLDGDANWGYSLWNVLVLQSWLEANPDAAIS